MLRWFLYISGAILIIDHAYTHYGPSIINGFASTFLGRQVQIVENPPHKESIIDRGIKTVKQTWNRYFGGGKNG